jgi:hypothetical protein
MRGCSLRTSDDGFGYDSLITAVILVLVVLAVAPIRARGQAELQCGVAVQRFLDDGHEHEYVFTAPAGARVLIDVIDVSGLGLIKKRVSRVGEVDALQETCAGPSLDFESPGGELALEISDCFGDGEGTYTLSLNVVSDDAGNCASPLSCGSTSDGIDLEYEGESDAYSFAATPDQEIQLRLDPLDASSGTLTLRVFDPLGHIVAGAEDCGSPLMLIPDAQGLYTAVVASCPGRPRPFWTGLYRLGFDDRDCPTGPDITYFGIASSQAFPRFPDDRDVMNRPVYVDGRGSNIILVVEGREGSGETRVGLTTLGDPLPDLQMLVSRDLGNGDPTVCDVGPPRLGGVAASPDLVFNDDGAVIDAMNDVGCRFDDGLGNPAGRDLSIEACTRSMRDFGFGFVDPTTTAQFCAEVTQSWEFQPGDTVVAARMTDLLGNVGARREIVVRVLGDTRTPTPTSTPTYSGTRTPTPTRGETGCVGDCNGDDVVAVDELITGIGIALGRIPAHYCWGIDGDEDGTVSVAELVDGVTNALDDCSAP